MFRIVSTKGLSKNTRRVYVDFEGVDPYNIIYPSPTNTDDKIVPSFLISMYF